MKRGTKVAVSCRLAFHTHLRAPTFRTNLQIPPLVLHLIVRSILSHRPRRNGATHTTEAAVAAVAAVVVVAVTGVCRWASPSRCERTAALRVKVRQHQ